jgi:hypothetical protein
MQANASPPIRLSLMRSTTSVGMSAKPVLANKPVN